jgi:MFS family permease
VKRGEIERAVEWAATAQPEVAVELAGGSVGGPGHASLRCGLGPVSGLIAVGLCGVFAFLDLYATQPLLPMFVRLFGATKAAAALTVSACTLGVAFSAPVVGALAQRLSRKRVVVASIVALSVPTLLAATSPGLHALVFWRLLQGLVLPGIFATTIAYITEEWAPEQVPVVMSIYITGTVLGGFLGRVIAGMAAETSGWRAAFVVLGAVTLAGSAVVARWLPKERQVAQLHPQTEAGQTRRWKHSYGALAGQKMLAVYAVGFNVLFSLVAIFTYVTFYLSAAPFSLSTTALSWLFAVYLVGLVVTPAAGVLLGRTGLRRGIVMATALSMIGVLLTIEPHLGVVLVGLTLCSSGVFVAQSAATSYLRVAAPAHLRTLAAGLYLSAYYFGGTVGGLLPSWVWVHDGWRGCVLLVAALQCVTMAVAWWGWE